MKSFIVASMLLMSTSAGAIPVHTHVPQLPDVVFENWETRGNAGNKVPLNKFVTPSVPEPSTYFMLLSGLAMIVFKIRRL